MVNKAVIPFLVTMMLVTGVCNTILNKYQVGFTFASIGRLSWGTWSGVADAWLVSRICNV